MAAMRAREPMYLDDEAPVREPLITVYAGESILIRVGAVDRQSGVGEIITYCRSCENLELTSVARWLPGTSSRQAGGNYYPVKVSIPGCSPTVVWELHRIVLCDREGNRRSCEAGRDFDRVLFQVLERPGGDSTPPRLLGVQLSQS